MQEESESPRKKAKTTVKEIKTDGGDEEEEEDEGDEDEENEDDDKNDDEDDEEEEGDEVSARDTRTACLQQSATVPRHNYFQSSHIVVA